jgi:proteasome lid subunit RPN8/RPN11
VTGVDVFVSDQDLYGALLELARPNMVRHTKLSLPHEAVGIVADDGSVYPLINQRRSATEYMVSRILVEEGLYHLRSRDLIGVALYHSHPADEATPSDQDLLMMRHAPGTVFVIHGIDKIAAYRVDKEGVLETVVEIPTEVPVV